MTFTTSKAFVVSALASTILMGCGGGNSDPVAVTPPPAVATTIAASAVVKYVADVQTGNSETTEANNIALVELAVDDTVEPAAI